MPIFLDIHPRSELPLDGVREFLQAARAGKRSSFGVRPLDLYCGDDGRVFYVVEAPDEASVRHHHAAHGAACQRVRVVPSVPRAGRHGLNDEQRAVIRGTIAAERVWPVRVAC